MRSLNIPPYHKYVTTLPCEIAMSENYTVRRVCMEKDRTEG